MRHVALACIAILLIRSAAVGGSSQTAGPQSRTRPAASATSAMPRIPPLPEREWTSLQRDIAAAYGQGAPIDNDLRTLLTHTELVGGVMPFVSYITSESTLPARDRLMLMLRTAWLTRSPYIWAKYASRAADVHLSPEDLNRIADGPHSKGLTESGALLLGMADELHRASFVSNETWSALAASYSMEQMMDAVFTVAEFTMLAETVNSARVAIDPKYTATMPAGGDRPSGPRSHAALATPRIAPLEPTFWTGEIRAMLDPTDSGREIAAVYRTFARHPALYVPRQTLSEHIRLNNTLPPRVREMLILRIGYLCASEYEWAAHARAGRAAGLSPAEIERIARGPDAGWNAQDAAILRAADELYADDVITNATWKTLAAQFDRKQLLDLLITTGGYRMVSMALNSFGVPLEPNSERFPK